MTNDVTYSPMSCSKGFARLLFDCASEQRIAKIGLSNGASIEGKLLGIEGDVLAVAVTIDRFNFEYVYVPTAVVISLAVHKDSHR